MLPVGYRQLDKAVSPTYNRMLPTRIDTPVDGTPAGDIFFLQEKIVSYIYYRAITNFYMSEFQTNPNESLPYRILHKTHWSKKGRIDKAMRLIVIQYAGRKYGQFAVRWQDKNMATFGGYSYETKMDAHNAFLKKYLDHNTSYGPGNVSHLPGIVK